MASQSIDMETLLREQNDALQSDNAPQMPMIMRSASGSRCLDLELSSAPSFNWLQASTLVPGLSASEPAAAQHITSYTSLTTDVRHSPSRRLKLVEQNVHRVDQRPRTDGLGSEKEMVISNLRWFHLRVAVVSATEQPLESAAICLKAQLLYENGLLVEKTTKSGRLLEGTLEVTTCNGQAEFKLKIADLSSHREKQRFRIQISAADEQLLAKEPALQVVTPAMKCVTKLRNTKASMLAMDTPRMDGPAERPMLEGGFLPHKTSDALGKRDIWSTYEARLLEQSQQIHKLQRTNDELLSELRQIRHLSQLCTHKSAL